jgi:hypothetical protein
LIAFGVHGGFDWNVDNECKANESIQRKMAEGSLQCRGTGTEVLLPQTLIWKNMNGGRLGLCPRRGKQQLFSHDLVRSTASAHAAYTTGLMVQNIYLITFLPSSEHGVT